MCSLNELDFQCYRKFANFIHHQNLHMALVKRVYQPMQLKTCSASNEIKFARTIIIIKSDQKTIFTMYSTSTKLNDLPKSEC